MKTPFWEQRQLGDVAPVVMGQSPAGKTYSHEESTYILVQGNNDIVNGFVKPRTWTTQKTREVPAGTILFSVRAPVGSLAQTQYDVVLGRGFAGIKGEAFIAYYLEHLGESGYWQRMSSGSVLDAITGPELRTTPIALPSEPERQRLTQFFDTLGSLIAAAERKCDLLKLKKQAYLQQMFPQNGEEQPRLRFKGFTGDWEQRQLGELAEVGTGSHNTQDGKQAGLYPFFIRSEQKLFMDSFDFDEEAILVPGDGRIGEVFHYQNGPYALHQRVYRLHDFHGISAHFLLYLLESGFRAHALKVNSQGTVPSLRHASFTDWLVQIPSPQEQEAIALLLAQLDSLISAAEHKLETLKQLKQGYLQQMFV